MALPILAAAGLAVSIGSRLLGSGARKAAEKRRAEARKGNALLTLSQTLSGLNARRTEELAAARQQKRFGRRQSAVLEAQAIAGGAESGTGSGEQVQDIALGESEFLSSVDTQLAAVETQLMRRRRGAFAQQRQANRAADSDIGGPLQDFLDFANTAAFAINAFDSLRTAADTSSAEAPKAPSGERP